MDIAKQLVSERQIYTSQIMKAHEYERRRIAQELHDDTIQELLVLANNMESLILDLRSLDHAKITEKAEWIRDRTISLSDNMRRLILDLEPSVLNDLGLVTAVTWLADRLQEETNIKVRVEVQGKCIHEMFNSEVETGIFRITQEAFSNIRRHSMANNVNVFLEFKEDSLSITINDDGRGFILPAGDASLTREGKLGLMNMQQRAQFINGELNISSVTGKGTTVSLSIPKLTYP